MVEARFGPQPTRAGVLGGPGTFAWLAFRRLAEACGWSCDVRYFDGVEPLLAALLQGEIDVTCVAVQTSPGGFTPVVEELIRHRNVAPLAETVLPYNCTLYVREGYPLMQVRLVLGHRSLELAREWLQRHLPAARLETRASTMEAAREVSQSSGDRAVVGSPVLQEFVPGLAVAARGIDGGAVARWWALSPSRQDDVAGTRGIVVGYSVTARQLSTLIAEWVGRGLGVEALHLGPTTGPEFRFDALLVGGGEAAALRTMASELRGAGGPFDFRSTYRAF